jgi:hypothetical protein
MASYRSDRQSKNGAAPKWMVQELKRVREKSALQRAEEALEEMKPAALTKSSPARMAEFRSELREAAEGIIDSLVNDHGAMREEFTWEHVGFLEDLLSRGLKS